MKSVTVNTKAKAINIIKTLKKQGRTAFYEVFASYEKFEYMVFYR